jgi:hypothetical protein
MLTASTDIIEGVNVDSMNGMALHTSDNCTIAGTGQTGILNTNNCYWYSNGNMGCGSHINNSLSYGQGFNANGGGVSIKIKMGQLDKILMVSQVYAMEWTSNWIRVWFFPRASIPSSILNGNPDPTQFGIPAGNWQGSCNITSHFGNHTTVFDNTFCGDYAGNTYGRTTCPQYVNTTGYNSCKTFVATNPTAFNQTYWSINYMRIYQQPFGISSSIGYSSLSSATPITSILQSVDQGMGQTGPTSSMTLDIPTTISSISSSTYQGPNTIAGKYTSVADSLVQSSFEPFNEGRHELRKRVASQKRGLVYVPNKNHPEDDQIWYQPGSDITWYYNYGWKPSPALANTSFQFVPMLFGNFTSTFNADIRAMVATGVNIPYILAFNEPDLPYNYGGSNINPAVAADAWLRELEPLHRDLNITLGAPACSGSQGGFTWLASFFNACAGRCSVSFLPLHWYGDFQGLASHIGQAHAIYPNLTIWLTEFADANAPLLDTQVAFNQSISYMDRLAYIDHYSYFGSFRASVSNVGPNATMLDNDGRLTGIGSWYLNVDPGAFIPVTPSSMPPTSNTAGQSTSISSYLNCDRHVFFSLVFIVIFVPIAFYVYWNQFIHNRLYHCYSDHI